MVPTQMHRSPASGTSGSHRATGREAGRVSETGCIGCPLGDGIATSGIDAVRTCSLTLSTERRQSANITSMSGPRDGCCIASASRKTPQFCQGIHKAEQSPKWTIWFKAPRNSQPPVSGAGRVQVQPIYDSPVEA